MIETRADISFNHPGILPFDLTHLLRSAKQNTTWTLVDETVSI
jgi:hypothetical protein